MFGEHANLLMVDRLVRDAAAERRALVAGLAAIGLWRLSAVAAPHMAALAIMLQTEADFGGRMGFVLAWGILNFFFITLLRRPALSGALSLTMVVVLVLLSRFKHDVAQMTVNFVDLMVIDRDTVTFLFTIFPNLRWPVIGTGLVTLPLMVALWWLDPFRIRRLPALACGLTCVAALTGFSIAYPDEAWRGYYDDGYLSKFARSGVTAIGDYLVRGLFESDTAIAGHLRPAVEIACRPAQKPPHIVMVFDESSFDITQAPGIKVPAGEAYGYTEGGNGELGFYIVSDGSGTPYRVRIRPPCFAITQGLGGLITGLMIPDVVPTFGSLNMIGGECDH